MKRKKVKVAASALLLLLANHEMICKERSKRRYSVRPRNRKRKINGFYCATFIKMKHEDPEAFFDYTRMNVDRFNELLRLITPQLKKNSIREPISPEERLAVTIHYLAHGSSMAEAACVYNLGESTVNVIIRETCQAISEILSPICFTPISSINWKEKSEKFLSLWQMPNCIGAIDGKHVLIQAPPRSGSIFHNYKKTFSICLMAVCDAEYNFTFVDIGAPGSEHDSTIFRHSALGKAINNYELHLPALGKAINNDELHLPALGKAINNDELHLPLPEDLPNSCPGLKFPYFFVADEAFPLKTNIMRPYSGQSLDKPTRIFNYRLSRARRTIENTFGILTSRWRILQRPIIAKLTTADKIVSAVVCLHNFIMNANRSEHCSPEHVESVMDNNNILPSAPITSSNNATQEAYRQRNALRKYLYSQGTVPWQFDVV